MVFPPLRPETVAQGAHIAHNVVRFSSDGNHGAAFSANALNGVLIDRACAGMVEHNPRQQHPARPRRANSRCDILTHQQPGDGYRFAEEPVDNRQQASVQIDDPVQTVDDALKNGSDQRPADNCQFGGLRQTGRQTTLRFCPSIQKVARHTDPIRILGHAIIVGSRRQVTPAEQVELVGRIHKTDAVALAKLRLVRLDKIDDARRFVRAVAAHRHIGGDDLTCAIPQVRHLPFVQMQRIVPAWLPFPGCIDPFRRLVDLDRGFDRLRSLPLETILGQPNRHYCNCLHNWIERRQVANTLMEHLTVVDLRQRNDLSMHRHADPTETPDLFQDIRHIGLAQQHRPQRAVGSVDGNVLRAEALLLDPLPVRLRQVGKGHEIAVQKTETIVIVLQVERTAQPFWHLGQKAERAFVVAGAQTIKERLDKLDPQVVIRVFLDLVDELLITATHQQLDSLFGNGETVIDHVTQTQITHCQHHIARLQSEFGGDAARGDEGDLAAFADYTPQIGLIFHTLIAS
jgi:hypothetical protein